MKRNETHTQKRQTVVKVDNTTAGRYNNPAEAYRHKQRLTRTGLNPSRVTISKEVKR